MVSVAFLGLRHNTDIYAIHNYKQKQNTMEYSLTEENKLTEQLFDLRETLAFQLKHDVQVIRGEDYQYMCYIDKTVYATGLTPMFAMAYGIKRFKENNK